MKDDKIRKTFKTGKGPGWSFKTKKNAQNPGADTASPASRGGAFKSIALTFIWSFVKIILALLVLGAVTLGLAVLGAKMHWGSGYISTVTVLYYIALPLVWLVGLFKLFRNVNKARRAAQ